MSPPRRSVPSISVARTVFSPGKEHQGDTPTPFDHFDDDDEPEPWLDFTEDLAARLGDLKTGVFESACTPTRRTPDLSKTRIVCPE